MSQAEFAVNFFVALFALIDPIGNVPLFAAGTAGAKARDRALIAAYVASFVLGFLTFFYFSGLSLLQFFGISMPAFRIAGGVILFLLGLQMARDDFTATFAEAAASACSPGARAVRMIRLLVAQRRPVGAMKEIEARARGARADDHQQTHRSRHVTRW